MADWFTLTICGRQSIDVNYGRDLFLVFFGNLEHGDHDGS